MTDSREDRPPAAPTRLEPVDQLSVQVLADNVTDMLSGNPPFVTPEIPALRRAGMTELGGEQICCACHGLSLVLTARVGGVSRSVLFDAGPEGYAVERNGSRLGLDFGAFEAIAVSHGHWDHAGGLLTALALARGRPRGPSPVPVHVHPDIFRQRGFQAADGSVLPFTPIPGPDEIERAGGRIERDSRPRLLVDGLFYLSGEIPRLTPYETGLPGHVRRSADGSTWEADPQILDEQFLAVNVRGKGLVVFTACSHAGVVNVLLEARRRFPSIPLHAVVGGLHLAGRELEARIPETVSHMTALDLQVVVPAHCTGWRAVAALAAALGDRVVPAAVGKTFRF